MRINKKTYMGMIASFIILGAPFLNANIVDDVELLQYGYIDNTDSYLSENYNIGSVPFSIVESLVEDSEYFITDLVYSMQFTKGDDRVYVDGYDNGSNSITIEQSFVQEFHLSEDIILNESYRLWNSTSAGFGYISYNQFSFSSFDETIEIREEGGNDFVLDCNISIKDNDPSIVIVEVLESSWRIDASRVWWFNGISRVVDPAINSDYEVSQISSDYQSINFSIEEVKYNDSILLGFKLNDTTYYWDDNNIDYSFSNNIHDVTVNNLDENTNYDISLVHSFEGTTTTDDVIDGAFLSTRAYENSSVDTLTVTYNKSDISVLINNSIGDDIAYVAMYDSNGNFIEEQQVTDGNKELSFNYPNGHEKGDTYLFKLFIGGNSTSGGVDTTVEILVNINNEGLSNGAIVGIVLGSLAGVALITGGIVYSKKKKA